MKLTIQSVLICLALMLASHRTAYAEVSHTVQRGETLESIAAKYSIDPDVIIGLNPDAEDFLFVGMELLLPDGVSAQTKKAEVSSNGKPKKPKKRESTMDELLTMADKAFEKNDYKKAAKFYGQALEREPSATLYFNRGISYYNAEKYNDAIYDFKKTLAMQPTESQRAKCEELIPKAEYFQQLKEQEQAETVGAILGLVQTGVSVALQASAENHQRKEIARQSSTSGTSNLRQTTSGTTTSSVRSRASSGSSTKSSSTASKSRSGASGKGSSTTRKSSSTTSAKSRSYSSSSSSSRAGATASKGSSSGSKSSGYEHRRYTPIKSTSTTPNTGYQETSEQAAHRISQDAWNKYLNPETFASNYMSGRPTLPSAAEMGLTGTDAYAYELQRNLAYREQMTDLEVAQQTQQLVDKGCELAAQEVDNFASIYGREPTMQEIDEIYKKHVQGYLDAYKEYVETGVQTHKDLGLGEIDRTDVDESDEEETDEPQSNTPDTKTEQPAQKQKPEKTTEKNKKTEPAKSSNNKQGGKSDDNYGDKIKNVTLMLAKGSHYNKFSHPGELYKKDGIHYVKVDGNYYKVNPHTRGGQYTHYIVYGAHALYLNY